jgi:hypothetical protein
MEDFPMRSRLRHGIALGLCVTGATIGSGCEGKQATEYVTGISTQVTVPRDLKSVRVEVNVGGVPQFCRGYRVYDGKVQLPRSLGTFPASDGAIASGPVTYTILGLSESDPENSSNSLFTGCAAPSDKGETKPRILRRSRQPYVPDEILFLPMPLKFACFERFCGQDETCKGGKCVSATLTDPIKSLPRYRPELVDGTGGECFRSSQCMAASLPAIVVDPVTCTYAVPNTPSAPPPSFGLPNPFTGPSSGSGVNVEVLYDGGLVREVLDLDPEEGFSIPDPTKPQQFRLAEGLCEMVKGTSSEHRISAVRASGTCQAKRLAQPLCAPDQLAAMGVGPDGVAPSTPDVCQYTQLKPPKSALMVIVDDTDAHKAFFTSLSKPPSPGDEESLIESAIRIALADPAFEVTDMALFYSNANQCGGGAPAVSPGAAPTVRDPILSSLKSHTTVSANVGLEAALRRAYSELAAPGYYKRSVVVFGNGSFDADECPDATAFGRPTLLAKNALETAKIKTYVMQVVRVGRDGSEEKQASAQALATAGGTEPSAYKTTETQVKFQELVNDLATCVYDVETAAAPGSTDTVSFANPLTMEPTKLGFKAECSDEGRGTEGWGSAVVDGKTRIYLCKDSCTKYRDVAKQAATFAVTFGQPSIPVPVYAHRVCAP